MTIEQTYTRLKELKIPEEDYYLSGKYGSANDNEKPALIIKRGKFTIEYEVYFRERGELSSLQTFTNEDEACEVFFKQVLDLATCRRIDKIEGLLGMTVNERLYSSGLMEEFDACKITDKRRAKQLLKWLKVDETSIEKILNSFHTKSL